MKAINSYDAVTRRVSWTVAGRRRPKLNSVTLQPEVENTEGM